MIPALLIRIGHPALCSHWLLLWALVVASRDGTARTRPLEWSAIGLVAGLLHPYLAVMVLTLLVAVVARSSPVPLPARARSLAAAIVAAVGGWWAAGLFSVSEAESLSTEGLGHYSMNLLAPITQTGWSQLLPDLPRATTGQDFEGFQYLGLGVLLLLAVAAWLSAFRRQVAGPGASRGASWHGFGATVFVAALAMAVFALSPRITFANHLVVDLGGPWTGRFAVFRATGRFFWPLAYLLLAWGIATICTRIPPRLTVTILMIAAAIQAIDLHAAHESRRRGARDPGFYVWETPMPSAVWHRILPHYHHLVLYPPPQCATQPVGYEAPAYLAGLHGLTINAGGVARPDEIARRRYCHDLGEQMKAGDLQDDAIFIVPPEEVRAIRTVARRPAVCGAIDRVSVCVTAASYQRWRDLATLD
jgi:hypothetical protein